MTKAIRKTMSWFMMRLAEGYSYTSVNSISPYAVSIYKESKK